MHAQLPRPTLRPLAALLALACVPAAAQTAFPAKPIRILVGFAPGGFTDTSARLVGQRLGAALGQQVVIENRTGANGLIAGDLTAKSPADGYTLFMTSAGLTTNPMLYGRLQRDPIKDFTAVALVGGIPNVLVVHPAVPARSVRELVQLARARPGQLTQASAGRGSAGHLSGELLQQMTGARFVHVPYKGSGPALIDLIGGQVDLSFPSISAATPQVKAAKLRAIGVTMAKRSPLLPDVPTIGERDVPGYEVTGWYGLVGPAGMPRDVLGRLNSEIVRILGQREVVERLLAEGAEPLPGSPEDFTAFIQRDQAKWVKVFKAANITPAD